MGIRKDDIVDSVEVVVTYSNKYRDAETGEPVRFRFVFREPSQNDINKYLRRQVGKSSKDRDRAASDVELDELCEFLVDIPEDGGFDDFPRDERPLAGRAREYFSSQPLLGRWVSDALRGLWRTVLADSYFR